MSTSTAREPLLPRCRAEVRPLKDVVQSRKHPSEPIRTKSVLFSPYFKTPDLDEEKRREGSRPRPWGIWDCCGSVHFALLSLFLSTTDTDAPIAKTYAETEDTPIENYIKKAPVLKSPRQLQSACLRLQPSIPRQHPRSFARSLPQTWNNRYLLLVLSQLRSVGVLLSCTVLFFFLPLTPVSPFFLMMSMNLSCVLINGDCFFPAACVSRTNGGSRWIQFQFVLLFRWAALVLPSWFSSPLVLECSRPWSDASVCSPGPPDPLCEAVKTMQHAEILPLFWIDTLCTNLCK